MYPNYIARKSVFSVLTLWGVLSCLLIVPIFVLVIKILTVRKYRIEFYDDKIVTYSGLFNTTKNQVAFLGVTSTSVYQPFLGHIFNYGHVEVDCVGEWDIDTTYIKHPQALDNYLQKQIIKKNQARPYVRM